LGRNTTIRCGGNPSRLNAGTLGTDSPWPEQHKTATQWFCAKFPRQAQVFGSPFLEQTAQDQLGFTISTPLVPNLDFFAACLGGDHSLGHRAIYHADEQQFYYLDPSDGRYHATTDAKMGNLYRALMARCAVEVSGQGHLLGVFSAFRSDSVVKSVVNRAKTLLEADTSYFDATSSHERVKGPELHQRLATMHGNVGEVRRLLAAHPELLGLRDRKQNSLLHLAVLNNHKEILDYLLTLHPDLAATNERGSSPLFNAAALGYQPMVEALLAAGANPNQQDFTGFTPLWMAEYNHHPAIAELLRQHGAH
jgi:hypothetical protein